MKSPEDGIVCHTWKKLFGNQWGGWTGNMNSVNDNSLILYNFSPPKYVWANIHPSHLKVNRSRNKLLSFYFSKKNKKKRTNLTFYPDDSEILET